MYIPAGGNNPLRMSLPPVGPAKVAPSVARKSPQEIDAAKIANIPVAVRISAVLRRCVYYNKMTDSVVSPLLYSWTIDFSFPLGRR